MNMVSITLSQPIALWQ